jgi:hypothetical protein
LNVSYPFVNAYSLFRKRKKDIFQQELLQVQARISCQVVPLAKEAFMAQPKQLEVLKTDRSIIVLSIRFSILRLI